MKRFCSPHSQGSCVRVQPCNRFQLRPVRSYRQAVRSRPDDFCCQRVCKADDSAVQHGGQSSYPSRRRENRPPAGGRWGHVYPDLVGAAGARYAGSQTVAVPCSQDRVFGQAVLAVRSHAAADDRITAPRNGASIRPGPSGIVPLHDRKDSIYGRCLPAAGQQKRSARRAPVRLCFYQCGLQDGKYRPSPADAAGTASRWPACRPGNSVWGVRQCRPACPARRQTHPHRQRKTEQAAVQRLSPALVGARSGYTGRYAPTRSCGWRGHRQKAVPVILDGFDQPGRNPLHPQKKVPVGSHRFPAARYSAKRSQCRPP